MAPTSQIPDATTENAEQKPPSGGCVSLKREVKRKQGPDNGRWRDFFAHSWFVKNDALYLLIRVAFALLFIAVIFWSVFDQDKTEWSNWQVYLTNWTLIIVTSYLIAAASAAAYTQRARRPPGGPENDPVPFWVKIIHLLYVIALPGSFLVMIMFWCAAACARDENLLSLLHLFPPRPTQQQAVLFLRPPADAHAAAAADDDSPRHHPGEDTARRSFVYTKDSAEHLKGYTYFVHGVNFLVMLIDAVINQQPYYWVYTFFCFVPYASIWVVLSVIFWVAGGTVYDRPFIYKVTDWGGKPRTSTAFTVIVILVILPIVSTLCWFGILGRRSTLERKKRAAVDAAVCRRHGPGAVGGGGEGSSEAVPDTTAAGDIERGGGGGGGGGVVLPQGSTPAGSIALVDVTGGATRGAGAGKKEGGAAGGGGMPTPSLSPPPPPAAAHQRDAGGEHHHAATAPKEAGRYQHLMKTAAAARVEDSLCGRRRSQPQDEAVDKDNMSQTKIIDETRASTGGQCFFCLKDKPGPTALLHTPAGNPNASAKDVVTVLEALPNKTFCWDGVRDKPSNDAVKQMKIGDLACLAHLSKDVKERKVIATMEVVSDPKQPDPLQFDVESPYFDAKATPEKPIWLCVEVKVVETYDKPIPVAVLESEKGEELLPTQSKVIPRTNPRQCALPVPLPEHELMMKFCKGEGGIEKIMQQVQAA